MDLSGSAPPTASQKFVSMLSFDECWIFDGAPWQLRKCVPLDICTALLHSKPILLRVGSIPNVVSSQEKYKEKGCIRFAMLDWLIGDVLIEQVKS